MRYRLPLAALITSIAACSIADESDGANSAFIETSAVIKPVDLVRCWTVADTSTPDPYFQQHTLHCERPVQDAYPLVPDDVAIQVWTAKDNGFNAHVTDAATKIGSFHSEDLPLTIQATLRFPESSTLGKKTYLNRRDTIASLTAATQEKPLAFASPFTLWGVALRKQAGGFINISASYEMPTGLFRVPPLGVATATWDNTPSTLQVQASASADNGRIEMAFVAPEAGAIAVEINGRPFELAGPGAYVFGSDDTLRKEEAAGPPPGPDLVDPPPTPACGTEGQAACPGGECAPGHQLKNDVCSACGTDGKPYCGSSFDKTCEAGNRLISDVCRACGKDGQPYCGQSFDKTCEPGHRVIDDVCRACGSEGQPWCGASFDKRCNEGLHVSGDNCVR